MEQGACQREKPPASLAVAAPHPSPFMRKRESKCLFSMNTCVRDREVERLDGVRAGRWANTSGVRNRTLRRSESFNRPAG